MYLTLLVLVLNWLIRVCFKNRIRILLVSCCRSGILPGLSLTPPPTAGESAAFDSSRIPRIGRARRKLTVNVFRKTLRVAFLKRPRVLAGEKSATSPLHGWRSGTMGKGAKRDRDRWGGAEKKGAQKRFGRKPYRWGGGGRKKDV